MLQKFAKEEKKKSLQMDTCIKFSTFKFFTKKSLKKLFRYSYSYNDLLFNGDPPNSGQHLNSRSRHHNGFLRTRNSNNISTILTRDFRLWILEVDIFMTWSPFEAIYFMTFWIQLYSMHKYNQSSRIWY